jgi:hypothetical protein
MEAAAAEEAAADLARKRDLWAPRVDEEPYQPKFGADELAEVGRGSGLAVHAAGAAVQGT